MLRKAGTWPTGIRTAFCGIAGAILVAGIGIGHVRAEEPNVERPTKVGFFLQSLSSIDPATNSYVADFFVWTLSPLPGPDPLESLSLPQSSERTILEKWSETHGETLWSVRQIRARFGRDWNLANFPFDRHVMQLVIGPYSDTREVVPFTADLPSSGFGAHAASGGWQIRDFRLEVRDVFYPSNFGDPKAPYDNDAYDWIVASFELTRDGWWIFTNLMTGSYIAFIAAMIACLMKVDHPPVFAGRMSLQIACLFAIIINHRQAGPSSGKLAFVTLPDTLHLVQYLLLFAALLVTLRARALHERGRLEGALRWSSRATIAIVALFIFANAALIGKSLTAPPERDERDYITLPASDKSNA